MIFNSFTFLVFFVVTYALYDLSWRRYKFQNRLLLIASYVFYGYWDWRFLPLLAVSTVVDYYCGKSMVQNPASRRAMLFASIGVNIGTLFVFKYFGFFQENLILLMRNIGVEISPITIDVILPLGLSFYTFQKMTYVIEIYQGRHKPSNDFLDFALFVTFFPLLLSGPIERAHSLMPQIGRVRNITSSDVNEGLWLVTWGLFKKIYVADNLALLVDPVFAQGWHGTGGEVLIALYGYAFQIYCDFSGYTDIARGVAKLLGFNIMLNFNLPYFATNPSEFWRRWHISLSTWLRDYVYFPLGGSRAGGLVTYRNLFITMLLVGLWHGAAWTFVIWGIYHGILLILHRLVSPDRTAMPKHVESGFFLKIFGMFHLTCLGWLLFRAESLQQAAHLLHIVAFSLLPGGVPLGLLTQLFQYIGILLIVQVLQFSQGEQFLLGRVPLALKGVAYGVLFYMTALHGGTSNSFIYFQF